MQKFQVGDNVIVTAGKDKGKKGKITKVLEGGMAVVVQGANIYKKHVKPQDQKPGGVIEKERPLAAAKIAILGGSGKPTRVAFKKTSAGKYRIDRKTGKKL